MDNWQITQFTIEFILKVWYNVLDLVRLELRAVKENVERYGNHAEGHDKDLRHGLVSLVIAIFFLRFIMYLFIDFIHLCIYILSYI